MNWVQPASKAGFLLIQHKPVPYFVVNFLYLVHPSLHQKEPRIQGFEETEESPYGMRRTGFFHFCP